jgi:hypothetical protein
MCAVEQAHDPEEEETQDEDPKAETTSQAEETKETSAPKQPANEIKVVIIMKDDNIMLGVQSPDCDPVYKTMKGDLGAALQQVPGLVAEAKQKWAAAPRYPKANLPEPPPSPTPARRPAAPKPTETTKQPSFF